MRFPARRAIFRENFHPDAADRYSGTDQPHAGIHPAVEEARLFVDFPEGYGNRMVVDRAFAVAGAGRRVAIEVTDITSAAGFVREGLGVSMLPAFAVRDDTGLILKRVSDAELEWPLGVAVSALRQPSAAARALLALIGESAA